MVPGVDQSEKVKLHIYPGARWGETTAIRPLPTSSTPPQLSRLVKGSAKQRPLVKLTSRWRSPLSPVFTCPP